MSKTWIENGFVLAVAAAAAVVTGLLGLWAHVASTATPLHPRAPDVPSVTRSAPPPSWAGAVDRARLTVRTALSAQNLPGLSVAVGVDGVVVWAEGFGWANLEQRVRVSPDTQFRIGTASVALTSAAAGVLIEQGRFALDDEIQTHVPAFPRKPWPVTLRQVMGHVAGVDSDGGDEEPLLSAHCARAVDALPAFAERPLRFEPGTQYRYSSYGSILVSAAIEAAAKAPFHRFMRKQVFEPLGMDDTRADSVTASRPDRATSYFPRFAADPRYGPDAMREVDYSCLGGASVFLSTPSDLVRFGMAITRGRLLQPATVRVLQSSLRLASGQETGYGLGWNLEDVTVAGRSTRAAGHDGDALGGRVASLLTFQEHGLVVSVTSNISYADTSGVAVQIAGIFAESAASTARRP